MNLQIPSEYEDFVSDKSTLLREIKLESNFQDDFCLLRLYFAESINILEAFEKRRQIQSIVDCIASKADNAYLWHQGYPLTIYVVLDEVKDEIYLSAAVKYGDYIEDEWFLTYIAMQITKNCQGIFACIQDNDGEFLLIEAADHLDSWIEPETSKNRVWIVNQLVHIIPPDATGLTSTVDLEIFRSVNFLRELYHSNMLSTIQANRKIQKAIQLKTAEIYPERLIALDHHVTTILPKWAAALLQSQPFLIGQSVSSLSTTEAEKISKTIQNVKLGDDDDLVAQSIRMTKAQYAQMTFKQFRIPRKYHSQMRRMSVSNSAKVQKAFDLGCRITCGLELAVLKARQNAAILLEENNQQTMIAKKYLSTKVTSSTTSEINQDTLLVNSSQLASKSPTDKPILSDLLIMRRLISGKHQAISDYFPLDSEVEKKLSESEEIINIEEIRQNSDKALFETIKDGKLRWDNDDWLYLTPEEFEKRIQRTVTEANGSIPSSGSATATVDNDDQGNEGVGVATKDAEDSLQSIVDGFKSFLLEKSEVDGVETSKNSRKSHKSNITHSDVKNGSKEPPQSYGKEKYTGKGFGHLLNIDYLDALILASDEMTSHEGFLDSSPSAFQSNDNLDGGLNSDDEISQDSDDVSVAEDDAVTEDNSEESLLEKEDDEDDCDSYPEEFAELLKDPSLYPKFKDDDDYGDDDEAFYSMEDIQRAMDSELMDENAFANTFHDTLKQKFGDNFDLASLSEEDLDEHFLSNFLNAHAEGLGTPVGPFQQILSQMGLAAPRPPPSQNK